MPLVWITVVFALTNLFYPSLRDLRERFKKDELIIGREGIVLREVKDRSLLAVREVDDVIDPAKITAAIEAASDIDQLLERVARLPLDSFKEKVAELQDLAPDRKQKIIESKKVSEALEPLIVEKR